MVYFYMVYNVSFDFLKGSLGNISLYPSPHPISRFRFNHAESLIIIVFFMYHYFSDMTLSFFKT